MIKIKNMSFSYGKEEIYNNASLSLPAKGVFILKGENGCGKSTLLNIILGNLKPISGEIIINGEILDNKNSVFACNQIAYISQENDLINYLNAKENASLFQITHGEEIKELKLLDENFSDRHIETLSSGERTIVSIQRAINEGKNIFLLDECTDYLDQNNTNKLIEIIKELSKNALIVIVSHDERIIDVFDNEILVQNKKIVCKCEINKEITNKSNDINKKRKYKFIVQRLLKKQTPFITLFTVLLLIFNTLLLTIFCFGTYSLEKSHEAIIQNGNSYSFQQKDDRSVSDIFKIDMPYYTFVDEEPYTSEMFNQIKNEKFMNGFDILNANIKYTNEREDKYVYLNKKAINNYDLADGLVTIKQYPYAYKLPYKIIEESENIDYELEIPYSIFSEVEIIDPITFNGALWYNDSLDYSNKEDLIKLIGNEGTITFMTKEMYEKKYSTSLSFDIKEDEIYISSYLSKYYVDGSVSFYDYSNYDLGFYYSSYVSLGEDFTSPKLMINQQIQSKLQVNEVIVSDDDFKKISRHKAMYPSVSVSIDDTNRNEFINFIQKYNLKFDAINVEKGNYSRTDYLKLVEIYNHKKPIFIVLFIFINILEIAFIYVIANSFYANQKNNITILNRYYKKSETKLIYSLVYALSSLISIFLSIPISIIILNTVNNTLKLKVVPFSINLTSCVLLVCINLFYYIFYYIFQSEKK